VEPQVLLLERLHMLLLVVLVVQVVFQMVAVKLEQRVV
jgi:hypothetical protein